MTHSYEKPFNEQVGSIRMRAAERCEAIAYMQRAEGITDRSSNLQHVSIRNRNKASMQRTEAMADSILRAATLFRRAAVGRKPIASNNRPRAARNELRSFGVG